MKYILVGETHGTLECPRVFLEIIKKHKIKQVALEFAKDKQEEIDQYLLGSRTIDNLSIFKEKEKIHDGRASNSIKELVSSLKKNNIKIYFVDSDQSDPLKRDYEMARNLMNLKNKTAFLCGSVHASKTAIKFPKSFVFINKIMNLFGKGVMIYKNGIMETCGTFLPEKETISYKIVAVGGGRYYNFRVHRIKSSKRFKNINLNNLTKIVNSKKEGFDYFYLVDKFTPSY